MEVEAVGSPKAAVALHDALAFQALEAAAVLVEVCHSAVQIALALASALV